MTKQSWAAVAMLAVVAVLGLSSRSQGQRSGPGLPGLVTASSFTHLGAFRLPASGPDTTSFGYGGAALAFHGPRKSLLLMGHDWYQRTGEVTIPQPGRETQVSGLPTASLIRPPTDILAGKLSAIGLNGQKVGGILPVGDDLIVSAYVYYDAAHAQRLSHFRVSANGAVSGPYQVGNVGAGFVSGFMAPIPAEWQGLLGGSALTGNCCLSIISRTSLGPSATVFDPANLASQTNAKMVLGYPIDHATLGGCTSVGRDFNCSTLMRGMVFPAGTRSLLFFGRQGTTYCYGTGVPTNPGRNQCLDPSSSDTGEHGYPYVTKVWAYDVNDLVAVKNGTRDAWQVLPYATWEIALSFSSAGREVTGASYDPETRRLFLGAAYQDGAQPLIHVFQLGETVAPAEIPDGRRATPRRR